MMWCTDGREMMRRQTVRNNVFLLVSLARMWMTGMHIIIITVPAVAGGTPVAGAGVVIIKEL